jgi:hypothetical protein
MMPVMMLYTSSPSVSDAVGYVRYTCRRSGGSQEARLKCNGAHRLIQQARGCNFKNLDLEVQKVIWQPWRESSPPLRATPKMNRRIR